MSHFFALVFYCCLSFLLQLIFLFVKNDTWPSDHKSSADNFKCQWHFGNTAASWRMLVKK